jgi:hypothetical protein
MFNAGTDMIEIKTMHVDFGSGTIDEALNLKNLNSETGSFAGFPILHSSHQYISSKKAS